MTTPGAPSGRPSRSVSPDDNFSLAEGFNVLISTMQGVERAIEQQISQQQQFQDAQARYGMGHTAGGGVGAAGMMFNRYMPQASQEVLRSVAATGGMAAEHMTAGMTRVTPMAATASLQNLKAFSAQALGEALAGSPLYGEPGQQPGGMATAPGATPAGVTASSPGGGTTTGNANQDAALRAWLLGAPAATAPATGGPSTPSPPGGLTGTPGGGGPGLGGGAGRGGRLPMGRSLTGSSIGVAIAQQVPARIALSGGKGGSLLAGLRHLPGIGLGLDLIEGGADFYEGQREAARPYQEVEGGSNLAAQAERFHQGVYGLSMLGRMPEGAASQAFSDVTALGYNRMTAGGAAQQQNRQSALNFIYHNYTGRGMSVEDSVKVLETASQNSAVSLDTVSDALKRVSDTAGKAGTNAETARQQFNSLMAVALGQGAGPGAPGIAGAIAGTQAAYGRQFASTNFSGEASQTMQYMLSGKYGISPSQTQFLMRTQPQEYARMLSGNNLQVIEQLMTPPMMSSLRQMISQYGGGQAMTGDIAQQISQQFLNQWQVQGNINLDVWSQVISQQTGIGLNANTVMPWIVQQVAGNNEAAHTLPASAGRAVSAANTRGAPTGQYGLAQGVPERPASGRAGTLGLTDAAVSWQKMLQIRHGGSATSTYLSAEKKSGKRSPILEALLQNLSQDDKVQVQTKNGPRVMSLADAMKYYPAELESGNVQFFSSTGEALGNTSAITHGLTDPGVSTQAEMKQSAGSGQGVPLAQWRKKHPAQATGAGGKMEIGLTQEARHLLKLLPSGNNEAAATGSPPVNTYVNQGSR